MRAAESRLLAISGLPEIKITPDIGLVAEGLMSRASLPAKARLDALHIANPAFRPKIEALIRAFGYEPPVICTPQELIEV